MIEKITLFPVGKIGGITEFIKSGIKENLSITVKVGKKLEIPEESYNSKRAQFSSSKILDYIFPKGDIETPAVLIIDRDLYTKGLNFVFGQADPVKKICIFSITRLKPQYYNLLENEKLLKERSLKEAIHEIGHIYGLQHCKEPSCVMYFSNSLSDTDRKSYHFCSYHKKRLKT